MSKRRCISLLYAPLRSQTSLQRCSLQSISNTVRGSSNQPPQPRQHQQQNAPRRRPFSTTPQHHVSAQRQVSNRKASQPSMSVAMKAQTAKAQETGLVLDHIGIVEGTFIPPTGSNLPSLVSNPRGRAKLLWLRLKYFLFDIPRNYAQAIWLVTPRPRLIRHGELRSVTKTLYEGMYAHFARGDLSPVEATLAPGLQSSLRARIAQRQPNSSLLWTLHRYMSAPRVISHRLVLVPDKSKNTEKMGIEQAVVKIRSRQSLMKMQKMRVLGKQGKNVVENVIVDADGDRIPDEFVEQMKRDMSKDTTEYVVVQRLLKKSKFEPWKMWGTAEESTLEKLAVEERTRAEQMRRATAARA